MSSSRSTSLLVLILLVQLARCQDTSPSGPTMPNIASNCNAFYTVVEGAGDSCWSITQKFGITLDQFYEWNPDVTDDCTVNFWPTYSYCVGVGPVVSTSTTTTTSAKPTTTAPTTTVGTTTSEPITSNTEPYSTQWPITSWNITATSVETTFPPQRTQSGQPASCNNWWYVGVSDTCDTIVQINSWLTLANL